jgi:microcystin degradation protein MlrC
MRLFIAALGTETNTFSPIPTGWAAFRETLFFRDNGSEAAAHYFSLPLKVWRAEATRRGYQIVESVTAYAEPAGPTIQNVWESLRDMVLQDLSSAAPVDLVLLHLHGAMISESCDDCEGDLLKRIRHLVGPEVVIAVELDLHCHLTEQMLNASTLLHLYKEYPHIDVKERALELFHMSEDAAFGRTRPAMAVYDCRMLGVWRTQKSPSRSIVQKMHRMEQDHSVLSVSFCHGFPWADVPEVGAKVIVITDGDIAKSRAMCEELGREIWDLKEITLDSILTLSDAIDLARSPPAGLTVLADVSDNAGAGAPSDSTFVLRYLLDAKATKVLTGYYWDPVSVRFCLEAGENSSLQLRIGGKVGPLSGDPVDVDARVLRTKVNVHQSYAGGNQTLGDVAIVQVEGVHIALNSVRTQTYHPDAFAQLDIQPQDYATIFVKSAEHFTAGFAPIADRVLYLAAPGVASPDFRSMKLSRANGALWPTAQTHLGQFNDPLGVRRGSIVARRLEASRGVVFPQGNK